MATAIPKFSTGGATTSSAPADLRKPSDLVADQSHVSRGDIQGDVTGDARLMSGYYLGDKFLGNYFDPDKAAAVTWSNNNASGNYMEGLAQTFYDTRGGGATFGSNAGTIDGKYIPGSRPIFDKDGALKGYQVADASMMDTTTSRRQNNESRKYLNLDWMKENITSAGADKWGNATFFISADKAKDDRFGWEWSHYRGEQQGGMNPLGLVAAIGLTAFGMPALATAMGGTFGATLAAGAMTGAGAALVTGGDPIRGAITGGVTAGVGSYVNSAVKGATGLSQATKAAATGAAMGATGAVLNGGSFANVLTGAAAGGAGGYVNTVVGNALPPGTSSVVSGAVRGAATGATMAGITGNNVGQAATVGLIAGAAGGLSDDQDTSSGISRLTRGVIAANSVRTPTIPGASGQSASQEEIKATPIPSFGTTIAKPLKFKSAPRQTNWTTRR